MDEVRDGKLDFALTKPEDAQLHRLAARAAALAGGRRRLRRGVIGRRRLRGSHAASASATRSRFLALLLVGALLLYCFWLILATGAFWVVNMWFLSELFEGMYQAGRWPIGIYPGWLRYSMTYLVPIGFAVTVPAQAMTHRLHWATVVHRARASRSR